MRLLRTVVGLFLLGAIWLISVKSFAQAFDIDVDAEVLSQQRQQPNSDPQLKFVGGLVLRSSNPYFGALSGLRVTKDDEITAVTDTGFWFRGKITRDNNLRPIGITSASLAPILDGAGKPFEHKWNSDAEGLTFSGKYAFVSTEQDTRVLRFDATVDLLLSGSTKLKGSQPAGNASINQGFESIATLPTRHRFEGGLIVFHERVGLSDKPVPGFILHEGIRYPVSVVQSEGFSVTDADFIVEAASSSNESQLVLLERRFSVAAGAQMRLRRISSTEIKPGAVLKGEIIHESRAGDAVDNMEGLSIVSDCSGSRFSIVSDDNHWLLQRTLYLEFKLERADGCPNRS